MAAPVGNFYPVGLQHARVYSLSEFGYPLAPNKTGPYDGLEITGPNAFDITPAKSRDVVATGNDRRLSQDKLPSLDVSSAVIKTSRLDFALLAMLTGQLEAVWGESRIVGFGTDLQGQEPTVGLLAYQKGKIAGTGARAFGAYHMPSVVPIIDPASMGGSNPAEYNFNIVPSPVNHYLFGLGFTLLREGYTESEVQWSLTFGRPHIAVWLADTAQTDFAYNVAMKPTAATKIHCIVKVSTAGMVTDITSSATKTNLDKLVMTAPGLDYSVIAFYEY